MNRQQATQFLREQLDANLLQDWHIRLTTDITCGYLGLTSYKDKTIFLNAHHIDTHPDEAVRNTILHELAHALTPGAEHNQPWINKAHELGCTSFKPCARFSLSESAIDAIRSGATLKVDFDIETIPEQKVYKPKYSIQRIVDHCPTCGKVAKERDSHEVKTSKGWMKVITLECLHVIFKECDSHSEFESITFDGNPSCSHTWGKDKTRTKCTKCNAKRLYEYQIEGCKAIERANGKLGIFDEQGLGKTLEALGWLKFHPEAFPYGWVTRSGIKFQHAKEIVRILGKEYFPQVLMSGKDSFIPNMKGYLFSYDIFRRLPLESIKELGIKTWILDECQAIKNPDSTRTSLIRNVVRESPYILPLSGTPWKNRGSEFFVALNLLDPKKFYSFQSFKNNWVDTYWDGNRQKEGGILNPQKFKEYTKDILIRRERKDVMPELPLVNRTQFLCAVPEHARKLYNEEVDKLVRTLNDAAIDGTEGSFAEQSQVMQNLLVMRQIVGLAKVDSTVELAKEFLEDTDRKLVIFVHHKKCGEIIFDQLKTFCADEGILEPLKLIADMDSIARENCCNLFNNQGYRVLIASTLASGEGLNLQSCSDCIMHERQWNPANEEQAEGRFIRIGQLSDSVNAIYVHGDDTIDTILDGIVERKRLAFQSAMNSGVTATWNEGSIVKELAQAIVNSRKNQKGK